MHKPITECCIIDQPNTGYYLTHDIIANGDCIKIIAENSAVFCNGYSIIGNGSGTGIEIDPGLESCGVRNCSISNFEYGIVVGPNETYDTFVDFNIIHDNWMGIWFKPIPNIDPSEGATVRRNIIFNNFIGVRVAHSRYSYFYDNFFTNNTYHVYDDTGYVNWYNVSKTTKDPFRKDVYGNIISGPYIGGNYWDDYEGNDTDGDGLGEDWYAVYCADPPEYCNKDYLPLVDINAPRYYDIQGSIGSIPYSPSATYTFNITWKDNVQIDKVIFELDGVNHTNLNVVDEYFGFDADYRVEHRANYSISFTGLELGTHTYRWYANDTRNNWNSTQLYNFTIVEDNIPPSIEIISPKNITYYNYVNVKLEFTINEAASWIAYSLDHQENITIFTNVEAGTYTKYIYISNYGSHNIIVYAKDTAGNTGKSERIHFTTKRIWGGGGSFRCLIMLY